MTTIDDNPGAAHQPGYAWRTLTSAVVDPASPLRAYLQQRFPHRATVKTEYKAAAGPLLVPAGACPAGTLGTAFDLMLRFVLKPTYTSHAAEYVGLVLPTLDNLQAMAHLAAQQAVESKDVISLARQCWILAWFVEIYRTGQIEHSPLAVFADSGLTDYTALFELVPDDGITQQADLLSVAVERFYPSLANATVTLDPVFTASALCAAEADLIVNNTLIDIKTTLGVTRANGDRADTLQPATLNQLLAYALFDTTNAYDIQGVGIYTARYGHLHTWPLTKLLTDLAGGPVDLDEERAHVWAMLNA